MHCKLQGKPQSEILACSNNMFQIMIDIIFYGMALLNNRHIVHSKIVCTHYANAGGNKARNILKMIWCRKRRWLGMFSGMTAYSMTLSKGKCWARLHLW